MAVSLPSTTARATEAAWSGTDAPTTRALLGSNRYSLASVETQSTPCPNAIRVRGSMRYTANWSGL